MEVSVQRWCHRQPYRWVRRSWRWSWNERVRRLSRYWLTMQLFAPYPLRSTRQISDSQTIPSLT